MTTKPNEYNPQTVTHPGSTLKEKLQELEMGNKEFAIRTGKPEKTITAIVNGSSSITPEMAIKFEDVLKIPASFWLNRQRSFDEYKARIKRQEDINAALDWAKNFPYAKMATFGWVNGTRKAEEKVINLFNFFGVANHLAWESFYYKKALKVSFRISLAHLSESGAVAAWLRMGEVQAKEHDVNDFDQSNLKKAIPWMKSIMSEHPQDFFTKLQNSCATAGVKLVYTPCLPKAPIHGSTRWLGDTPLIQLSARYKTNDKFWFTFFHELGHILLHGKKYVAIENIDYEDVDHDKEKEADEFAIKHTFSKEDEEEVLENIPLDPDDIRAFAKKFNTHPALIIGRFQHEGLIPFSLGREFIEPINLDG